MTWQYDLEPDKKYDGFRVVEKYSNGCYAELDKNNWWGETPQDIINDLKMILSDLEKRYNSDHTNKKE